MTTYNLTLNFDNLLKGTVSLMMALSWNNFIKESLANAYPNDAEKRVHMSLLAAVIVTIIVIIIVTFFNKCKSSFRSTKSKEGFEDNASDEILYTNVASTA